MMRGSRPWWGDRSPLLRTLRTAAVVVAMALAPAASPAHAGDPFARLRQAMIEEQVRARGVTDAAVLRAMGQVPRHLFIPSVNIAKAYADEALPLPSGGTVHQPYVVALMTSLLDLDADDRVLEIGTGSGYHAAVLSRIARQVYSVEIEPQAAETAKQRLTDLGYRNIEIRVGDGFQGWAEKGPFDAILLSAAPRRVPQPLLDQLRVGGTMVVPLGGSFQDLLVITKTAHGVEKRTTIPVRLPPMKGQVENGQ